MKVIAKIFVALVCLIYVACTYDPIVPFQEPTVSDTCLSDTVYYANTIAPLLNSSCAKSGCHDSKTKESGVDISDHFNTIQEVKLNDPAKSELYKVLNSSGESRMPPSPASPFTAAQKELVLKWIQQGAKNNACEDLANCVSTNVSYKTVVLPIVESACYGCHNASNKSGGIDLSSWDKLQPYVKEGSFLGSIQRTGTYSPMPKGLGKLSQCSIEKIASWIADGAKSN